MTEEKEEVDVYLRKENLAVLSVSVPKDFAVALSKLSKLTGLPKSKLLVGLTQYAIQKLLEEKEVEKK